MAFIVWREGRYAELLCSVRQGKSVRQARLAWLGARPSVTEALRAEVAAKHPQVRVDWEKIEAALASHPLRPEPGEERFRQLLAAVCEPVLHDWLTRYHRRIRRERVEVVEREWWPEFKETLLGRSDLSTLLLEPQLLDKVAYGAVVVAEQHYEQRRREQEQVQKRQREAERAHLAALVDAALEAIRREYTEGLQWASELLRVFPSEDRRASDVGFLRAMAAEAVRRGDATAEASEAAIEIVLSAASSGRLPRLWDDIVWRVPLDVPAEFVRERSQVLVSAWGGGPDEAPRNSQVLLNLLDARRREHEKMQLTAGRLRSRRR